MGLKDQTPLKVMTLNEKCDACGTKLPASNKYETNFGLYSLTTLWAQKAYSA